MQQQTQVKVSYFTALGDDPYSQMMQDTWRQEHIDTHLVTQLPGKLPGLYMIRTDAQGERTFYYYRNQAAAREMFEAQTYPAVLQELQQYNFIYFSGITCAILNESSRAKLFDLLCAARKRGAKICFDANYRPRVWPDRTTAQQTIAHFLKTVDIALPTFEDEQQLFGDTDPTTCATRYLSYGVKEVVVKSGPKPALIATPEEKTWVEAEQVSRIMDSTGAGDSFNAGVS